MDKLNKPLMDIKNAFRLGFLKKAAAAGLTYEQAAFLYQSGLHKVSTESHVKHDAGVGAAVGAPLGAASSGAAAHLVRKMKLMKSKPNVAGHAVGGGIRGAIAGAGIGAGVGAIRDAFSKSAGNDIPISTDELSDFKDQMSGQGYQPPIMAPDQSAQARYYNQHAIQQRDQMAGKNPDWETAKGALMGGGQGALAGAFAGHLAGHAQKHISDPHKFSSGALKKLPGSFRIGGSLLGALAGGVPAALDARHQVEVARKLEDPRNLDYFIRQMSNERHLANNDFNGYAQ
jgi:hypothetical protein